METSEPPIDGVALPISPISPSLSVSPALAYAGGIGHGCTASDFFGGLDRVMVIFVVYSVEFETYLSSLLDSPSHQENLPCSLLCTYRI